MPARSCTVGSFVAISTLLTARTTLAAPAQIHAVFWQQDTSVRSGVDTFFTCLTEGSTFGTTWCQQFGMSSVQYAGSYVLQSTAPSPVTLGGNLDQLMSDAFNSGALPAPQAGVAEEYLVYFPPTVTAGDIMGSTLCSATGPCAEHHNSQYNGIAYDLALVPISCSMCAMGLAVATIGGEHEAAEGLSDLAGSPYEVGDACEMQLGSLSCCGHSFTIQQLAGTGGPYSCQTINSVGSGCVMPPPDAGAPEDAGGAGGPDAASGGEAGPIEAGGGTEVDAGRGGSGGGGSGGSGGSSANNDAGGVTSGDAGAPPVGDDAGGAQDTLGGSSASSGCGCVQAGGPSNESAPTLVVIVGLLLTSLRCLRRRTPVGSR